MTLFSGLVIGLFPVWLIKLITVLLILMTTISNHELLITTPALPLFPSTVFYVNRWWVNTKALSWVQPRTLVLVQPYIILLRPESNQIWIEQHTSPGSQISLPNFNRIIPSYFNWAKIITFQFYAAVTFADPGLLNPALLHFCKVKPWTINGFSLCCGATIKHFFPLNIIIKCVKNLFCALLACEEGFLSTSNYVGTQHQMSLSASEDHCFMLMLQWVFATYHDNALMDSTSSELWEQRGSRCVRVCVHVCVREQLCESLCVSVWWSLMRSKWSTCNVAWRCEYVVNAAMIQMWTQKQNIITSGVHARKTFSFPFLNLQNGMAFALTLITCFVFFACYNWDCEQCF